MLRPGGSSEGKGPTTSQDTMAKFIATMTQIMKEIDKRFDGLEKRWEAQDKLWEERYRSNALLGQQVHPDEGGTYDKEPGELEVDSFTTTGRKIGDNPSEKSPRELQPKLSTSDLLSQQRTSQ